MFSPTSQHFIFNLLLCKLVEVHAEPDNTQKRQVVLALNELRPDFKPEQYLAAVFVNDNITLGI